MLSDRDLIERVLQRDARAFETLFERYEEPMRRHLARIVREDAAVKDLLQEVFLRVWTRGEQWNGLGPFKAWLYRVATNLALNHLRSVRRKREQPLEVPDDWSDGDEEDLVPAWMVDASALGPDAAAEWAERTELLGRFIDQLPEEKREVLRLVQQEDMDIRQIAEQLAIPVGTVKSRLFYARQMLARSWKQIETD